MRSASSLPEGYATLAVIDRCAPNYNAWLGKRLGSHLGKRVLEVGAGIGTITREILPGRELVIALEAEQAYATQLVERFHDEPARSAFYLTGREHRTGRRSLWSDWIR